LQYLSPSGTIKLTAMLTPTGLNIQKVGHIPVNQSFALNPSIHPFLGFIINCNANPNGVEYSQDRAKPY
jgi:hypothetical protein